MSKVTIHNDEYAVVNSLRDIEIGKRVLIIGVRAQFIEDKAHILYNWQILERLQDVRNVDLRDMNVPFFRILLTNDSPTDSIPNLIEQYNDITRNKTIYPIYIDNGVIQ